MKITHTTSGKAYELTPGTQIEIERTNLFFNDYGEQSYPVDLPDTPLNRELCGHPEDLANRSKPLQDIDCVISDGAFSMPCRQAVLGAKRGEKITTSFYMNEGSFLARMQQVPLRDVFGDETVPGVSTVAEGIAFCEGLMDDSHPHYSIAPLIVDLDGERHLLNRMHRMDENGVVYDRIGIPTPEEVQRYPWQLYNKYTRAEKVGGRRITFGPGYYITPLMRMGYLVERLFAHFGYSLTGGFLSEMAPLDKMVVLNNTADALVNGYIFLADLVPDCLCSDLLEVLRRKFCCEFVPDDMARSVSMVLFSDIMRQSPAVIDRYVAGHPEIEFNEPRHLKLASKETSGEIADFEGETSLKQRYPTAVTDSGAAYLKFAATCPEYAYYVMGYSHKAEKKLLADMRLPYYDGKGEGEDYEVEVPDMLWNREYIRLTWEFPGNKIHSGQAGAYLGEGNWLNSKLVYNQGENDSEETDEEADTEEAQHHDMAPSLALVYMEDCYHPQAAYSTSPDGYTLGYNGEKGIYTTFYREFDNLLRNAFHSANVPLLLTDELKQNLSVTRKVMIGNCDYLIDKLKYTVGGSTSPIDTQLLTATIRHPAVYGATTGELFEPERYGWKFHSEGTSLTEDEWRAAGFDAQSPIDPPVIYPQPPTAGQVAAGGKYYERTVYRAFYLNRWRYVRYHVWLEPVLSSPAATT